MSCPWRPPLETASDCPGAGALDKASYVGLYWPCRAGALAPRQLLKNHTASPREGPFRADTRGSRKILRELLRRQKYRRHLELRRRIELEAFLDLEEVGFNSALRRLFWG